MNKNKITIHGWVARDGEQPNGDKPGLCWFSREPRRMKDWPGWTVRSPLDNWIKLPEDAFPGLTWENGPMEVEVTIRPALGLTEFETALADIIHSWGTPDESPFNIPETLKEDAERLRKILVREVGIMIRTIALEEVRTEMEKRMREMYPRVSDYCAYNEFKDMVEYIDKMQKP